MMKTNPITSHHINIHTENDLCNWFETEYQSAVQYMGIKSKDYIYNMDKKAILLPAL